MTQGAHQLRSRLSAWWFGDQSVYPLILCRIGVGLTLFGAYLAFLPEYTALFGADGLAQGLGLRRMGWFGDIPYAHTAAYVVMLTSSLFFALGIATRTSAVLIIATHLIMRAITVHYMWGWSSVVLAFVLYIACSGPCSRYGLITAWRTRQGPTEKVTPAWTVRLIQIHICTIYLASAWCRLDNSDWLLGRKLEGALISTDYSRFPGVFWTEIAPLIAAATYAAWFIELTAPLMLWVRRVGRYWALALMGMHIVLELTITVGWWQTLMFSLLVVFLDPGWSARLVHRLCASKTQMAG